MEQPTQNVKDDAELAVARRFPKPVEMLLVFICVGTALFYIYHAYVGPFPGIGLRHRGLLFAVASLLCFLYVPFWKKHPKGWTLVVDSLLALLSVGVVAYLWNMESNFAWGQPTPAPSATDVIVGYILMGVVLEATRRVIGWPMVILSILLLLYTHFGSIFPRPFYHYSFSFPEISGYVSLREVGIWGVPMAAATTVIIIFLLFANLIGAGGGREFFFDLPNAIFGRFRGGPAKIAVVASSLFGTISGSVVANVTATGTFTIPLMKKTGYEPHFAGAVEAVASTGGQIMPPIMGVTAFVMAEMIGVSYWSIAVAAFIPAVLYYIALFAAVDLHAVKKGLKGLPASQLPNAWKVFRSNWFLLLPLILMLVLLGPMAWGPTKAGLYSAIGMIVVSLFTRRTLLGPRKIWNTLNQTTRDMVMIAIVCAAAGMVIGLMSLSGLGIVISAALVKLSGGNLLVLLVLAMVSSLILGMGMPTTPCYIFLAMLIGPALVGMGVPLLAAHLFIFYFGAISAITPPVAIGAFAGAALAGASPMKVGFTAMRLGIFAFIVPYYFVYNPSLIMKGTPADIVVSLVTAIVGVWAIAVAMEGFLFLKGRPIERLLFAGAGLALISNSWIAMLVGSLCLAAGLAMQFAGRARLRRETAVQ